MNEILNLKGTFLHKKNSSSVGASNIPTNAILKLEHLNILKNNKLPAIHVSTSIIIVPGYDFKIINGIITNFHQPKSTLLLLISAWTGIRWKSIYEYALNNSFRFLSYGDSSLLFR